MLFVLTGDVQTGKTRWLHDLVEDIAARGVLCEGVLAPGVWCKRTEDEMAKLAAGAATDAGVAAGLGGAPAYEKLGIENRLLPDGPTIVFGRRRDLVEGGGAPAGSQSEKARLGWAISDEAICRVNAHLEGLAACSDAPVSAEERHRLPFADEGPAAGFPSPSAFLVVDELGILELKRGDRCASASRDGADCAAPPCSRGGQIVSRRGCAREARARLGPAFRDRAG